MFAKATALLAAVCLLSLGLASSAFALPWDVDMYKQQSLKSNEIARSPVEGTVPLGYTPFTLTNEEAGAELSNPVTAGKRSLTRGKRLWSAQCLPCHGVIGDSKNVVVGPLIGAPSLLTGLAQGRTDGYIFGVIHNGRGAMPRYGYKLSESEKWDIVNYLRKLQDKATGSASAAAASSTTESQASEE